MITNKMMNWIKEHKRDIFIAGGTAIVVGTTVWFIKDARILKLASIINSQGDIIFSQREEIEMLKSLCRSKDMAHLELEYDALRNGSSIGGQELALWKEYMKVA